MNGTRKRAGLPYLPEIEDLLGIIDGLRRRARLTKADLAKVIDRDRSAVSNIFAKKRGLDYDEAVQLLEHLVQILSPLPDRTVGSMLRRRRRLKKVYTDDKVSVAANALIRGNFTQVPLYDRNEKYLGLVTDRMILERMLHPNIRDFKGNWMEALRNMRIDEAKIVEASVTYEPDSTISSIAGALTHFYALMLGENNKQPTGIVTRWDFLKLLRG